MNKKTLTFEEILKLRPSEKFMIRESRDEYRELIFDTLFIKSSNLDKSEVESTYIETCNIEEY